jgi:hypothetical protein
VHGPDGQPINLGKAGGLLMLRTTCMAPREFFGEQHLEVAADRLSAGGAPFNPTLPDGTAVSRVRLDLSGITQGRVAAAVSGAMPEAARPRVQPTTLNLRR